MVRALTVWLLCAAILLLLFALIPKPELCWIPPHAPTRGMYAGCWGWFEVTG